MQLTLARAYNAAGDFEMAKKMMLSHKFSPGEGAELTTAEPYMYALFAEGRFALKAGKAKEALDCFRAAQNMPENLNVGFWNVSVLMPYLYFEAVALKECGRGDESKALFARLAELRDTGMWNMGGEFVYYYAMSIREGGDDMRAKSIMRNAILTWEKELEEGCVYHKKIGTLYNCFVGDGRRNRLAELNAMLGYAELFCGNIAGAKERFELSFSFDPTAKIALELSLL
jgi:tetratricopeptide (TPR) repeat protein